MSQTADEYKEYSFDEGKLRIEYLPEVQDEEGHRIQLSRVRIKVTDMPPGKYKVGDSWVDECYAEPLMGKRMFYAFSEEDAQYWMHSLYRTYVDSPDDY